VLRNEARLLERRAERLRDLAVAVHAKRTRQQLAEEVRKDAGDFDLLRAALLIARMDNEEVPVDAYIDQVDEIVAEIRSELPEDASEQDRLKALNRTLFDEMGFHGSRTNYYHRSNSFLNEVIDDREGLPITLSLLYMEMARRLDLNVVGVGLPGHFVVRFEPDEGESQLVDVFEGAKRMSIDEAHKMIRSRLNYDGAEDDFKRIAAEFLKAAPPKAILVRMLNNLRGVAEEDGDVDAVLRYLNTILVIAPDNLQSRARRIDIEIRSGRLQEALVDIDWMLDKRPEGMDVNRVLQLRSDLEHRLEPK